MAFELSQINGVNLPYRMFKNIVYYLTSAILSKPLGFLLSFILAKELAAENFGVWITLMIVVAYGPFVCLGAAETLSKMVPYYRGKNDFTRVREIENHVMGSIVLAASVVALGGLAAPLIIPRVHVHLEPSIVVLLFMSIAASYFSAFFYLRFAAYENFKMPAILDFVRSVLALLGVGGLCWAYGFKGAVAGYFIHEFIMCLISARLNIRQYGKVGISFDRDGLMHAVRVGFPITLLWFFVTLQNSVDRIVLGGFLGAKAVGFYGLGMSLTGVLGLMPFVVGRVLYPTVNNQFGKTTDPAMMKKTILGPTLTLAVLLVNLQICVLAATPFLYLKLLPKYEPGMIAGQILLLGLFFGSLLRNGANYLIASNQERIFLKYILISLTFNIIANVGLVKGGWNLEGVALGTSTAGFLLTTLVWRRVFWCLGFDGRSVWRHLNILYAPFFFVLIGIVILARVYPLPFRTFSFSSIAAGGGLILMTNMLLLCLPTYRAEIAKWKNIFTTKGIEPAPTGIKEPGTNAMSKIFVHK